MRQCLRGAAAGRCSRKGLPLTVHPAAAQRRGHQILARLAALVTAAGAGIPACTGGSRGDASLGFLCKGSWHGWEWDWLLHSMQLRAVVAHRSGAAHRPCKALGCGRSPAPQAMGPGMAAVGWVAASKEQVYAECAQDPGHASRQAICNTDCRSVAAVLLGSASPPPNFCTWLNVGLASSASIVARKSAQKEDT